jgi:hypothetical protein
MSLKKHPTGDYSFVPGIAPYSCGVIANEGFEVVHVTLRTMVGWRKGFDLIDSFMRNAARPHASLCAMSLRCPKPFTFQGFNDFNAEYAAILKEWGVFVDGVNPVARTNIAPRLVPPAEPSLYAFAFTRPVANSRIPTFVVAGAGELPEGVLQRDGIVELANTSPAGLKAKAEYVMDLMEQRLQKLGTSWDAVNRTNVYAAHSCDDIIQNLINPRIGKAGLFGVTWHDSRPPIEEIEFEMDVRGVVSEIML